MMSSHVVIYHAGCPDGFTAAWVVWENLYGNDAEYMPAKYGDAPPDVTGRTVLIVDFSYSRDVLLKMHTEAKSLLVLDHHKGAREALEGLPFCTFDMARSGAGMAWDHIRGKKDRPWLVNYVEDRDLWRWALDDSKAVNAWVGIQDFHDDSTDHLPTHAFCNWSRMLAAGSGVAKRNGKPILRFQAQYVANMVRQAQRVSFGGFDNIPLVNCTRPLIDEVLNKLAETSFLAIGWSQEADGRFRYSLRSSKENGNVDVSYLAQAHGGSGHQNAAGFTLDKLLF